MKEWGEWINLFFGIIGLVLLSLVLIARIVYLFLK